MSVQPSLLRRLGTRDAALIVMGGIIGSGIFMNPARVARIVHTTPLLLLAWAIGGLVALVGAGVFAELAARRPSNGGVYAYMRDAYHPVVAFCYGWTLLLVSQSGGAAASAVSLASYVPALTGAHVDAWGEKAIAIGVIALFTIINCLGVRAAASTQNTFMIAKIVAILGIVGVGLFAIGHAHVGSVAAVPPANPLLALALALVPIMFAYSGWQTSSFVTGELREPQKTLPRGMLWGVLGVATLYLLVNAVAVAALGEGGLAASKTPASDVVGAVLGSGSARIMAGIVSLSFLGFVMNQILTAPRVYYEMAEDRSFFPQLSYVDKRTHVPVIAIAVQGIGAIALAAAGVFDTIQNWVTSVDYVFFALSAVALFIFRRRDAAAGAPEPTFRIPLHPYSTAMFLLVALAVVADVIAGSAIDSLLGLLLLLTGVPAFVLFRWWNARQQSNPRP